MNPTTPKSDAQIAIDIVQSEINTLKSQNERLVRALQWAITHCDSKYFTPLDFEKSKEAKAVLAEVGKKTVKLDVCKFCGKPFHGMNYNERCTCGD